MSGINPGVFIAVSQIRVTFSDDIGNTKLITGTGFWLQRELDQFFVTNRHNIDARLKLGSDTKYRSVSLEIQLRQKLNNGNWAKDTSFEQVDPPGTNLWMHEFADVAIIRNPIFPKKDQSFGHSVFTTEELATQEFLSQSLNPMDAASFIGFPGKDGKKWYDEDWNLPIARTVHLASWPKIPFNNSAIPTQHAALVSGLSFSGSSGSPVISHEKGFKVSGGLKGGGYVPATVLGLMSGHWWNEEPNEGMFFHSGLSYFTQSTAIWELLKCFK